MVRTHLPVRIGLLAVLLTLGAFGQARAQQTPTLDTRNVFLITTDGLRWQEVFSGADEQLVRDPKYTRHVEEVVGRFWRDTPQARREALLPFFWGVIAERGRLYGNRELGSKVNVTNDMWFSYPGYNEILTGLADPDITSNDAVPNANVTVLEFVNRQPGFEGKVAAFATWDNFTAIINAERSGIPVDAGHPDAATQAHVMAYLEDHSPRLLYVAYGATDHFAHAGDYEAYLDAAHHVAGYIRELWEFAQSNPQYRGKTTFIITTDHGRGLGAQWTSHGKEVAHADEIWIAILGPDTPARGEVASGQLHQNQIARTVAALLGLDYQGEPGTGEMIEAALPE